MSAFTPHPRYPSTDRRRVRRRKRHGSRRMSVPYGEIARVLGGARRRQVWVVLLGALGFGAAAALLFLLAGASALALGARPWARALSLAATVLALTAAVALALRALLRTAWSDEAAARTVSGGEPALRSDLVSSVELSRERGDIQATGRFSIALVDAHLARTAERARGIDLAHVVPARLARAGLLALLAVAVVNVVALLASDGALSRGYARLLASAPPPASAVDPITGDIELTFRYPAYMKREARTLSGTGGEIRAPKGTEVELRTRADRKVEAAELEIAFEADGTVRPEPFDSGAAERPLRSGRTDNPVRPEPFDSGAAKRPLRSGQAKSKDAARRPGAKRFSLSVQNG